MKVETKRNETRNETNANPYSKIRDERGQKVTRRISQLPKWNGVTNGGNRERKQRDVDAEATVTVNGEVTSSPTGF